MPKLKSILRTTVFDKLPPLLKMFIYYVVRFKRFPRVFKPERFNDKIINRKLFDNNYLYSMCSDKVEVRKYIEKEIGSKYLIPLMCVLEKGTDIYNFPPLTNCAIKSNNGAGMVKVIDGTPLKDEQTKSLAKSLDEWLEADFSKVSYEPHYKKIVPKILIEKSISIDGKSPIDYKFHCFKQIDGEIEYVLQVIFNRNRQDFHQQFYLNDLDNCIRNTGNSTQMLSSRTKEVLKHAITLNNKLCQNFNYVRIDWYVVGSDLYFGELTFTSGSGVSLSFGDELDKIMGQKWVL